MQQQSECEDGFVQRALPAVISTDRLTEIAVTAWLRFVSIAILDWLDDRTVTPEQLRDMCASALLAAVGLPPDYDLP